MSSSSLFNLPILTEATQNKSSELVAKFVPMNNLAKTTNYLNKFNKAVITMETSMLTAVSEAESTKKENEAMAQYFEEYGAEVNKLVQKINQQSSKFIININNFLDANDYLNIDLSDFNGQGITYKKKCYTNLTNPELPKISVKKIFKKEYVVLGKVLQDLKHAPLTDEARVTAITSVYDALISSMGKDWIDNCIQVITGDDNANSNDFSSVMYSKFTTGEAVVDIDTGEISQAKFTLSNTDIAAKQLKNSFDELIDDLLEVSEEIEHIWFRNKENMVEIKTDEDGVEDAKYALTDYSMNRVHQIIKAKIDQLNEVVNLYLIALSIKMDCIMKSAKQAREIIDIALSGNKVNIKSTNDNNCDLSADDSEDDFDDTDIPTDDSYDENDDIESEDLNNDMDDNIQDEVPDSEPEDVQDPVTEGAIILDEEAEFERDCYLFENTASRVQLLAEQLNMYNEVYTAVNELSIRKSSSNNKSAAQSSSTTIATKPTPQQSLATTQTNNQSQTNTTSNTTQNNKQQSSTQTTTVQNAKPANADKVKTNEIAEKINKLIAALINKVRELVQKFQNVVINKNNKRIEEIKANQKTILANGVNGGGKAKTYDIAKLQELKMHIDYPRYKNELNDEEDAETKYINAAFPQLDMKDNSLTEAINKLIVSEDEQDVTADTIRNAVGYITSKFDNIVKDIQQAQNELTNKSHNAKNEAIRYMKESATLEDTMFHYFTEFDAPDSSENNNQVVQNQKDAKEVTKDIKSQLLIMYKVNSTVLTTKMSLAQKAFNEYYAICKFFMTNTVVSKAEAEQQQNGQQQNNN